MSDRWFRVYASLIDDPKWIKLVPDLKVALITAWCIAADNNGRLPSLDDIAIKFRLSEQRTKKLLAELIHCGLIDEDENGLAPHNWSGRQYKSEGDGRRTGSYVYFVGKDIRSPIKIGISKNPWARLVELQVGAPDKLEILATFQIKGKFCSEVDLHGILAEFRSSGEWFNLPVTLAEEVLRHSRKISYDELLQLLRSNNVVATTRKRSSTTTETETEADRVRETRARESMISLEAFELAAKYLAIVGVDAEDVTWSGWPYSVQTWLSQGHPPARILSIGAKLCGKSPRMSYHATAVTSELSRPTNTGQSDAKVSDNSARPWQQRRDDWCSALDELSASVERDRLEESGQGSDGTVVPLATAPRRG